MFSIIVLMHYGLGYPTMTASLRDYDTHEYRHPCPADGLQLDKWNGNDEMNMIVNLSID